eukprot:15464838-Alexandrium_andersonii.AAC.1
MPRPPVKPMFRTTPACVTWPAGRASTALRADASAPLRWSLRRASTERYCSAQYSRCRRTS